MSQSSPVDDARAERGAAMVARLHEYAAIAGERLNPSSTILEAAARGNVRAYESEVTRLANRFVARLEASWT